MSYTLQPLALRPLPLGTVEPQVGYASNCRYRRTVWVVCST